MESLYPVNEIVSMNAYFYVSNIPTFGFIFLSIDGDLVMNAVMQLYFPFFIYFIFFYKTDLVRYKAE